MTSGVRNRLLILGAVWGLLLAAVPALVMTDPYTLTKFLVVAILCAVVSGAAGTFVAGRRALRRPSNRKGADATALRGVALGAVQVLVAGVLAALLFWAVIAVTISGFTLQDPVELSVLMSPRIFLGSFFVALSAFAYTLVGGLLLGPIFGPLVERATIKEKELVR